MFNIVLPEPEIPADPGRPCTVYSAKRNLYAGMTSVLIPEISGISSSSYVITLKDLIDLSCFVYEI